MRLAMLLVMAISLGLATDAVLSGPATVQVTSKERDDSIADLIHQLGHPKFGIRLEAAKKLADIGEPALAALRKAAEHEMDLEIRTRAGQVIKLIMPWTRKSRSTGLQMVVIEPGEFLMGSPKTERGHRGDEVQHKVRFTRPFYLGTYEVTQEQYHQVMKNNPSWFCLTGGGRKKIEGQLTVDFPVESVTWFDALEFCNRLSLLDGYQPYYTLAQVKKEKGSIQSAIVKIAGGNGYRLPTEAEWEYCCRAGTTTLFSHGNSISSQVANVKSVASTGGYGAPITPKDLGRTAKVGSFAPNRWGLYDMHGNVAEWCWDWYDSDFYAKSPLQDPLGPDSGFLRILRGGSWIVTDSNNRSACRFGHAPDDSKYYVGFRVLRMP